MNPHFLSAKKSKWFTFFRRKKANTQLKLKSCGFTLIELLIVIAIISILSAIAILMFSGIQKKSRDAKRQSDLKVIQSALEQYHADQNFYPAASGVATGSALTNTSGRLMPTPSPAPRTYLKEVPSDPLSSSGRSDYCYIALPAGSTPCDNSSSNICTSYELYSYLEDSSSITTYSCSGVSVYNLKVTAP